MNRICFSLLLSFLSVSIFAQNNLQLRSVVTYPELLNDVWGYTDTATGREYAIVGLRNATSIVDVTKPDSAKEITRIAGPYSVWRDIKTYGNYAYVVHDFTADTSQGLLIIDLTNLPISVDTTKWYGDTLDFQRAHNIWIDENGFAYLWASNKGALILDLKPDPKNPVHVGNYSANVVHDGYVRGDTMWTAEIYAGQFAVTDVSDKANPVVLATHMTSSAFTHNIWLSDDGKTVFTTDELSGAKIDAYDVSDLTDIKLLDSYQHKLGTQAIPHNTFVKNNYLVNSYYTEGVTIVDASRPSNLIEIGNFDTSPADETMGFKGAWGAFPFFPSQTILASDIEEGLFVFSPTYTRACYLEGTITDSASGSLIKDVSVEIVGTNALTISNTLGQYQTGYVDSGFYAVRFTVGGCDNLIIPNIELKKGIVNNLNVIMTCSALSTNNISEEQVQLKAYPSIFREHTTLKLLNLNANKECKILITNIQGQVIQEIITNKENSIFEFGNDLQAGMYLINITGSNFNKTIKTIKIE